MHDDPTPMMPFLSKTHGCRRHRTEERRRMIVKKVIQKLLTTTTIAVFMMTIAMLILGTRAAQNNTLINLFGFSYSVVGSDSMNTEAEDGFKTGDVLIIRTVPFSRLQVGDIIAFRSLDDPIYIVHRIIEIDENGHFITQGDANQTVDPHPVTRDNYFGQVIFNFDSSGIGQFVLNYRSILFAIIIGIFLIIIVFEIINLFKSVKEKQTLETEEQLKKRQETEFAEARLKMRRELEEELKKKNK